MAKSEILIKEKVATRKEHKKRKKTKGGADVKATEELFEADTKLSNENYEGDEPKLKKSKQKKKMGEEKSDDFKAEMKKIIDEGRKNERHFVSGSVESNNDTVGNGDDEAKPKRAKKTKNKHEDTERDIEMKTKEKITNKTVENGSNSPDKEAHDKEISNQKIGKAKASKSKKKDLKNIENYNSSPEEENLEKVIEGNEEENIKGILNQMETAKLKKIKKSTEKRKKSKTEDDELKNGEQKDDLVPAKKKKKLRDNKNSSEENRDVESFKMPKEEPGIEYLLQWKNDRSNWSFKKIKQIWLLRNMYDQKKISDKHFKILRKYLKDLKGKSKDETLAKAKEIVEREQAEGDVEDEVEKIKQNRAMEITRLLS